MSDQAIVDIKFNTWSPFIAIFTPAYRRPIALARHIHELNRQTMPEWQHIILRDEVGHDWAWVGRQMAARASLAHAPYVMYLDDDDMLAHPRALEKLRVEAEQASYPDVIVCQLGYIDPNGRHYNLPEPAYWRKPPVFGHIGGQCIIARRPVWLDHIHALQPTPLTNGACDFPFVESVLRESNGYRVHWWAAVVGVMQSRGNGKPEIPLP